MPQARAGDAGKRSARGWFIARRSACAHRCRPSRAPRKFTVAPRVFPTEVSSQTEPRRRATEVLRRLVPEPIVFDPFAPDAERQPQLAALWQQLTQLGLLRNQRAIPA